MSHRAAPKRDLPHGREANALFMHYFRPGYVRTRVNDFGEVWEPAPH